MNNRFYLCLLYVDTKPDGVGWNWDYNWVEQLERWITEIPCFFRWQSVWASRRRQKRCILVNRPSPDTSGNLRDSLYARQGAIGKEDLLQIPIVLREEGSGTLEVIRQFFDQHQIRFEHLNTPIHLGSTESIKNFLLDFNGLAIISEKAVQNELYLKTLIKLPVNGIIFPREFRIAHKIGHKSKLTDRFEQFLLNYNFWKTNILFTSYIHNLIHSELLHWWLQLSKRRKVKDRSNSHGLSSFFFLPFSLPIFFLIYLPVTIISAG